MTSYSLYPANNPFQNLPHVRLACEGSGQLAHPAAKATCMYMNHLFAATTHDSMLLAQASPMTMKHLPS